MANLGMTVNDLDSPRNGLLRIRQIVNGFEDSRLGLRPVKTGDNEIRLQLCQDYRLSWHYFVDCSLENV